MKLAEHLDAIALGPIFGANSDHAARTSRVLGGAGCVHAAPRYWRCLNTIASDQSNAVSFASKTDAIRERTLRRKRSREMATIVAESPVIEKPSARTREHLFFGGMSGLIALVVFIGFARTYYLAGIFDAKPLAAPIVHIHGAVFSCWIALLLVQTSLISTSHTGIHRRLGVVGLGLAPLMVLLGVLVAYEMLNRTAAIPGFGSPLIFAVALSEIAGFAVPVFFAFRLRRRSAVHKRLILIGTIATTTAGFGRWPVAFLLHKPLPAMLAAFTLLMLLIGFDLLSTHRLHRATVLGSAWVVFIELTGFAVGHTTAWHAFARAVGP
jgi:hypothetical protein